MKRQQQKPTEAQTEIIRQAGLDPDAVTVASESAALPLAITYQGEGAALRYWIERTTGGLVLSDGDEAPTFSKPAKRTEVETDEPEPVEIASDAEAEEDARHVLETQADETDLARLGFDQAELLGELRKGWKVFAKYLRQKLTAAGFATGGSAVAVEAAVAVHRAKSRSRNIKHRPPVEVASRTAPSPGVVRPTPRSAAVARRAVHP